MEKKYNQTKISEKISTNLDELDLPDEVKMKSFTDDVIKLFIELNF